jgi:hypothetical protein
VWIILTHIYSLLLAGATVYGCVESIIDPTHYEMYSFILYSVLALSLLVTTIVIFLTVNESASVDIEDEVGEEETSMLIKRMSAVFLLAYIIRVIY